MGTRHHPVNKSHLKLPRDINSNNVIMVYSNKPNDLKIEGYYGKILDIKDYTGDQSLLIKCRNPSKTDGHKGWVELKT